MDSPPEEPQHDDQDTKLSSDQIQEVLRMYLRDANGQLVTIKEATQREQLARLLINNINENHDLDLNSEKGKARRQWLFMHASSPKITILVGPSERRFLLSRTLLQQHSIYFRKFQIPARGNAPVFLLPECNEYAFGAFSRWLHFGHEFADEPGSTIANHDDPTCGSLLLCCYVLAYKLQALGFKQRILDEVHVYYCGNAVMLSLNHIRYVYASISDKDDLLRRFCMRKMCVQTWLDEGMAEQAFLGLMVESGPLMDGYLETRERLKAYKGKELHRFMFE